MGEGLFLTGIVALLLAFAAVDLYVTYRFAVAASVRPRIAALTGVAVSAACTTLEALLVVAVALNQVYFVVTGGDRVLPVQVATLLLTLAVMAPSLGKLYLLRLIVQWDRSSKYAAHVHTRASDAPTAQPKFHRRHDDPPPDAPDL